MKRTWDIRALLAAIAVAIAVLAPGAGTLRAAQPPAVEVEVWAGGTAPADTQHGVRMGLSGRGQVLVARSAAGGPRRVRVAGPFRPGPARLARIRAAAWAALAGDRVALASRPVDGAYVAATVRAGTREGGLIGVNDEPAGLRELVDAVNAALPATARLAHPPSPAALPVQAAVPVVPPATEVTRSLTLKEAAARGMLRLTGKGGGFSGDQVAVDLTAGQALPGPVRMTVRIEFWRRGGETPSPDLLRSIERNVEDRLSGLTAGDGTALLVDLQVRARGEDDAPAPGHHQILLEGEDETFRSYVQGDMGPNDGSATGQWAEDLSISDWTHEVLHLAGLEDQYDDVVVCKGRTYYVPAEVDGDDEAALREWARSAGIRCRPVVESRVRPGHENDIMADSTVLDPRLSAEDLQWLVDQAGVQVLGRPGDVLLNATPGEQNFGVGAAFALVAPRGGTARAEGLVVYCLDASRHTPGAGTGFDVLGPAAEVPGPGMLELQAVLEAIDRLTAATGDAPEGAQSAVWAVTDDRDPQDSGRAVLAAAGVAPGTYGAAHLDDPDTAGGTSAVGADMQVLPPAPAAAPVAPPPAPLATLDGLRAVRRPASRGRTAVTVTLFLRDAGDTLGIEVQARRGAAWRTVARLGPRRFAEGPAGLTIAVPRRAPRPLRVVVTGSQVTAGIAAVR